MKPTYRLTRMLPSITLALALVSGAGLAFAAMAIPEDAPRQQSVAHRGESVDAAIRRTMGDLPFKESFLRSVFLEINAQAVQPGGKRLISGASFQVPNASDLRAHLDRVMGVPAPVAPQAAAVPAAPAEKRHWVRFP